MYALLLKFKGKNMLSFQKFVNIKEAYQVDIDQDYTTEIDDLVQASKIFTIKNPQKMKEFLSKNIENDEELKNLFKIKFLDKPKQDLGMKKTNTPLGHYAGYDFLKQVNSPI